jgi:periplasmic divalent cation tolerance protein
LAGAAILILTQMPDRTSAQSLARSLVEARLAACVSIGTPVESLYHWQGQIETAQEFTVAVKTRSERYAAVEAAIRARHPYELPEIIAVPVIDGLAPYLDWIARETGAT